MNRAMLPMTLVCVSLSACAGTSHVARTEVGSAGTARKVRAERVEATASPSEAHAREASAAPASPSLLTVDVSDGMTVFGAAEGDPLALWSDPVFQRRFHDSFTADADVEPKITTVEVEALQKIAALLDTDRDKGLALLQQQRTPTSSALFDYTLGGLYFQQDELELAIQAFEVAVQKHKNFRRAWRNLATAHVRRGSFAESVRAFTRVLELGGGDGSMYGLLGLAYVNLERYLEAESALRMAILFDPKTVDWKLALARTQFQLGRFDDAAALCGQLIAENPDRPEFWLEQAKAFLRSNKPEQAAQNFEVLDQLGKATTDSLNALGDIYVISQVFEPGVSAYLRALEQDPSAPVARALDAARVLVARNELVLTGSLLDRLEELRGETLTPAERKRMLGLRAQVAVAQGATAEEAAVLEELVALDPLDGGALLQLAKYYGRNGDPERAVMCFERAAARPETEADACVGHAQLLVNQSKFAEALPLLRRAQKLNEREHIQEYLEAVERKAQAR